MSSKDLNEDVHEKNDNEAEIDKEKIDSDCGSDEQTPEMDTRETTAEEITAEGAGKETEEDENVKYMRLAADFQNYKRRAEKEKNNIYAYANEKIVLDLLEVMDNFERGIEHVEDEGIHMILKQFKDVFAKHDVEEIDALGEPFDPNLHHAVVMEPSDKYESGTVMEVIKKGYILKDKVIRHAMVKVAE